jgi:glucose-6-phosphate 1-epimerase
VIHDDALNRTIDVVHHHQHNVVAWNPGPALSVSMGDMPDDGYKTFVCVETCCVTRRKSQRRDPVSPGADHQREKTLMRRSLFLDLGEGAFLNHIQRVFRRRRNEASSCAELLRLRNIERGGILHHMLNTGRFRDRQHPG